MLPSPSLGPPLLSASWSPPLFCGIELAVDFVGVEVGRFDGADWCVGCEAGFGEEPDEHPMAANAENSPTAIRARFSVTGMTAILLI
jgi:hypothetical protein